MPQYFFDFSDSLSEEMHLSDLILRVLSHLEFLNVVNVSFTKGYARLFLAILVFNCIKSVTTLLFWVYFLLTNITGLEYAEKPSFNISR